MCEASGLSFQIDTGSAADIFGDMMFPVSARSGIVE
jgi:hypothetical protein